jgi:ATP/maltotriose-dependent transcriptional regulator MalT
MPKPPAQIAKLSRPRLFDAITRERLFELLDGYRRHPLVWVVALPGAGKTTLVATWLEARKLPGIWYQVDSGDADPATFFYYLRQAEQSRRGHEPRRVPLPSLTPEYLADLPGFTKRFFRELFDRLGSPAVVVLDNFQDADECSALPGIVACAVGEAPRGVQSSSSAALIRPMRSRAPTPIETSCVWTGSRSN